MLLTACRLSKSLTGDPQSRERPQGGLAVLRFDTRQPVKHLVPLILALLVLPSVALAAGASHDEPEHLNRADMTLAKRATIHKGDLPAGWLLRPSAPETGDRCPSFDPDLSAFVITGKATTTFMHSAGAQIVSDVAVFRTVRH